VKNKKFVTVKNIKQKLSKSWHRKPAPIIFVITVIILLAVGSVVYASSKGTLSNLFSPQRIKNSANSQTQQKKINDKTIKTTPTPTTTPTPNPTEEANSQSTNVRSSTSSPTLKNTTPTTTPCNEEAKAAYYSNYQSLMAQESERSIAENQQLYNAYYYANPQLYGLYAKEAQSKSVEIRKNLLTSYFTQLISINCKY
jgi:hypothetical protein